MRRRVADHWKGTGETAGSVINPWLGRIEETGLTGLTVCGACGLEDAKAPHVEHSIPLRFSTCTDSLMSFVRRLLFTLRRSFCTHTIHLSHSL